MENGQRIFQKFILISSKCRHLQRTSSTWIPDQGLCPCTPLGQAPKPFYRLALPRLLEFFQVIIIPSRSLRSSSTTISVPLRKTSITTSRSFSSTVSEVYGISCLSMFPLPRRYQFSEGKHHFIPSCLPRIHYTDHQNRNLLQHHVVHLTLSSTAPTISWFLHSRLGLSRYWRVCAKAALLTHLLTY